MSNVRAWPTLLVLLVLAVPAWGQAPGKPPAPRAALDLRAPPINHVLSAHEIEAITAYVEDSEPESILIRAPRKPPACCGTFIAVPWAIAHPNEAWRIFSPFEGGCPGTWCTEPLPPTQPMTPMARPTALP